MDLTEVEKFEAVKVLKLSEAILIGCPYVRENKIFSGCAVGTGYWQLTGRNLSLDARQESISNRGEFDAVGMVAEAFQIPRLIVQTASSEHYSGRKSREQVADWLSAQGY